ELFETQVERTPNTVALVYNKEEVSYRELDNQAIRAARHLRSLGVGPDVPVGICAQRSTDMVVGLLGILKAGGAFVPLDPAYPKERLTSGSTGTPKGVELSHRGLVNLLTCHQRAYRVTPQDRATQLAGFSFDASVWELWPYLTAGASIHIVDDETRTSSPSLVKWLSARKITISFVPTPV